MKILTLNTWTEKGPWRERWEIIFEFIRQSQPDVVAFQEIFSREWAKKVKETLDYSSLAYPEESKTSGLAALAKFPLLECSSFKFAAQSQNTEPQRYLLFAQFKAERETVSLFNTHLTWRPDEGEIRKRQADEILNFIGGQAPAIVCGDFNAAPETPEVRKMSEAGFMDTYESLNPGSKALTWDNRNPYAAGASVHLPDRRIDFVFARGFDRPESSEIVLEKPNENGVYASDHYGVLSEF